VLPGAKSFGLEHRIRRRAEFQRVYEHGVRIRGRYSTFFLWPNKLEVGRLGIAASKKLGGAVQRNRAKRLIREIFRRCNNTPGLDIVVVPRRELLDAGFAALERDYRTILERHIKRA
jgi:ribonuclease P protein component